MNKTAHRRFWEKVVLSGNVWNGSHCWDWRGAMRKDGYGIFWHSHEAPRVRAHRFAWEDVCGPIPSGLVIDHLCRNTKCVNRKHLEPVTNGVNVLRGFSPSAIQARQTHCKNGHALHGANLASYSNKRLCLLCERRKCREAHHNDKERRNAIRLSRYYQNRGDVLKKRKEYYEKNREKLLLRMKIYKQKRREKNGKA